MDRRIIKTRTAIKTAYAEFIKEKGSAKITITEIARRANIDRKTFYLHYNSTDDIMCEIVEDYLSDLILILNENELQMHPQNASIILQHMNACIIKDFELFQCIANRPDFELFKNKMKEILIQKMIESLSKSTTLSSMEISTYSRFFISGITEIYTEWIRNETTLTLDELSVLASNVVCKGINVLD